jgi:hypothetical protein
MTASALTRPELDTLSNPDRSCRDAATDLERIATLQRSPEAGIGSVFEESLRLKTTLDDFESLAAKHPTWHALAVLVHAEHRLWTLNAATPLRHNPFLSHWIEALQRLGNNDRRRSSDSNVTAEGVSAARVELIKTLLRGTRDMSSATPRELYTALTAERHRPAFDIQPYVRMLEEEGIYPALPSPSSPTPASTPASPASQRSDFNNWKLSIPHRLATDPGPALDELTRLPIELPALDFLTTLLTQHTLTDHAIDPAPVITSYIQHALRRVEQMGLPPESGVGAGAADEHVDTGREAQSRAVRLLLLFFKNLMRKGLVGMQVLYFEIQEICVRYVWIREVREFRGWVEEGGGDS